MKNLTFWVYCLLSLVKCNETVNKRETIEKIDQILLKLETTNISELKAKQMLLLLYHKATDGSFEGKSMHNSKYFVEHLKNDLVEDPKGSLMFLLNETEEEKLEIIHEFFTHFTDFMKDIDNGDVRCKRMKDLCDFTLLFLEDNKNKYAIDEDKMNEIIENFDYQLLSEKCGMESILKKVFHMENCTGIIYAKQPKKKISWLEKLITFLKFY